MKTSHKSILLVILMVITLGLLSSCSDEPNTQPRVTKYGKDLPLRNIEDVPQGHTDTISVEEMELIYYRAKCLENGTTMVIKNLEPKALQSMELKRNDTVWVNVTTQMIDNADTAAMKYRIISVAR